MNLLPLISFAVPVIMDSAMKNWSVTINEQASGVKDVMEKKTPHEFDAWYVIPNTAHNDVVFGDTAPTITFPLIGAWIEEISDEA